MQQSDDVGQAEAPPDPSVRHPAGSEAVVPPPADPLAPALRRPRRGAARVVTGLLVAAALGLGAALGVSQLVLDDGTGPAPRASGPPKASGGPTASASPSAGSPTPTTSPDAADGRSAAVEALLAQRAEAVTNQDRDGFLATVDPAAGDFYASQGVLFDRLSRLRFDAWSYSVTGDGPGFSALRAAQLPSGSAIVRVRLTYQLAGTSTMTDREQYLTVVPRAGHWLLAADDDASTDGLKTERDLWDLGPVRAVHGDSSLVVADSRGATRAQMRHLADEADLAVRDVDDVWTGDWSRRPVIVLPRSQQDMATVIGSDGSGLAQIAAVTTGSFEEGLSRGDRIVINPAAWALLGSLGRRVVLTHEMTHVATRSSGVVAPPIWLSEGFADYVAYQASPVPVSVVASDVLDAVSAGDGPRHLPRADDFDASRGDIAAAYEGAWLACRMIAATYGEDRLVRLYVAMTDSSGTGWPGELPDVLGVSQRQLVADWKHYLHVQADRAAA